MFYKTLTIKFSIISQILYKQKPIQMSPLNQPYYSIIDLWFLILNGVITALTLWFMLIYNTDKPGFSSVDFCGVPQVL